MWLKIFNLIEKFGIEFWGHVITSRSHIRSTTGMENSGNL